MLLGTRVLLPRPLAMASSVAGRAASTEACDEHLEMDYFHQRATRLRVALVRHGESMNNVHMAQGRYKSERVADPDLSPRGYEQAEALGAFVSDESRSGFLGFHPLHELWVSPHRRTLLTVKPAAARLKLAPEVLGPRRLLSTARPRDRRGERRLALANASPSA